MVIKNLLIDIDGVLVNMEDGAYPGAAETINKLKEKKFPFLLCTNRTVTSKAELISELQLNGFQITSDDVSTTISEAVRYMKEKVENPRVFVLAIPSVEEEVKEYGCEIVSKYEKADFVLVGTDTTVTYDRLNLAFRIAFEQGAELVALHKNALGPREDGFMIAGGALVEGLEYSTGKTAKIIGKPNPFFYERSLKKMNAKPEETAMVGDDFKSDLSGAIKAGLTSILVKTGNYQADFKNKPVPKECDHVIDSIADIESVLK